jgi:cell division protein FtsI/penicillin-binding protein 2
LALAYGAIANRGVLMEPRLIERLTDQDGNLVKYFPPKEVGQAVSPRAAAEIIRAMEAVADDGGTAPRADVPGYTQAGKTGTSHKVVNGRYSDTIFDSTFVGFAPVSDPQIVVLVTMYGARKPNHYAGTVAAPVFAQIARDVLQYLEVPPDEAD